MEPSTPKKVHARNSVCRLCGGAYENRHLLRVFSKTGNEKNLASKIKNGCGILITEGDTLSKLICRKCEGFVSKVNVFKQNSQIMQIKLEQKCSVKRCVELSPSCKPPSKRSATCSELVHGAESCTKHLNFGTATAQATEQEYMEDASLSFLPLASGLEDSPSLPDVPELQLNEDDTIAKEFVQAANSQPAVVVADIVRKLLPSVFAALKLAIRDEINTACQKLCRRSDGSVLYGNTFESLRDFDFYRVWTEMETNIPFLIEIMNAVSGKNTGIEETKHELRVKFSFLYSVLMSERWHELSLLKRVNTILVIEGGCTKQARCL